MAQTASHVHITARIDSEVVAAIDHTAAEDLRTRTAQLEHLARIGLAGRERLKQLEALAAATIEAATAPANAAGAAHLREHARLCRIVSESQQESSG